MVIEENAAECDLEKKQNEGPKIVRNSRRPGIQISMWNHQISKCWQQIHEIKFAVA